MEKHYANNIILSIDPGTANFGWAIISNGVLLHYGKLENPLDSFTEYFNNQKIKFRQEIKKILKLEKINSIIIERFQMRLFNPGVQLELVSIMIGIIAGLSQCKIIPIIAGTWKNWFLKTYQENQCEFFFPEQIKNKTFDEHTSDAICLALYHYENSTSEKSKWFLKYSKIKDSCNVCWYKQHGCKKKELCKEFRRYDKLVKCQKCKNIKKCDSTRLKFGDAKKNQINKKTFGCVKFGALV